MRLGFELTLQQTQKLIMTQELRQAIQILQYTSQELQDYIYNQMEINPVIELDVRKKDENLNENNLNNEKIDWKEYFRQNEYISHNKINKNEDDDYSYENFISIEKSLKEHLLFQLHVAINNNKDKIIGEFIIENINNNGYLSNSIKEISHQLKISEEEVENILSLIQTFEPTGVGSRDLKECLEIQLLYKNINDENAYKIVDHHLDDLANNRLTKISKKLDISLKDVQKISDLIKSLEPKPGRGFYDSKDEIKFITPDAVIKEVEGEYIIEMNDSATPKIKINNYYKSLLTNTKDDSTIDFLNDKLNSALWVIKSIEQRKTTIRKVIEFIVKYQNDFLKNGKVALKPLILKDVAEDIEVHESTVSRAVNGKYVQTPQGIYELKFFFSSRVSSSSGDVSSTSIKSMIKNVVENEDTKKPLSDQAIVNMLKSKNIKISRRTVAKYRDELNIPSSTVRKRY